MKNSSSTLTPKQKEILQFIYKKITVEHLPPTLREIVTHFGFSSTGSARDHLKALVNKKCIRISSKKSRGIELIKENLFSFPILGRVQAGIPNLAMENIEGYLDLGEMSLSNEKTFALRVKGDSMIDAGIMEGDLVLVRQKSSAEVGNIVVALIEEEATIKYLSKKNGKYCLKPANPKYKSIPLTSNASIIGVVLTVIRKINNSSRQN